MLETVVSDSSQQYHSFPADHFNLQSEMGSSLNLINSDIGCRYRKQF